MSYQHSINEVKSPIKLNAKGWKWKDMNLKIRKKNKLNLSKSSKPRLVFKIHNMWNSIPRLNQEAQYLTNLMLKDEIEKQLSN